MKISFNWLKDFIEINESIEKVCDDLTQIGLEVEGLEEIEKIKGGLEGLVVGEVVECGQHPNADRLKVTKVDIGKDSLLDIVCGAPNVQKGQKVIVATVDTIIHPSNGEPFKIKKSKIRGEVSEGMICASDEISLGNDHDGIIVLDPKTAIGKSVSELYQNEKDYIIEIGLTPNRGDATSHFGTARDLAALHKRKLKKPEAPKLDPNNSNPIDVVVENHEACPRYCGVTIRGVKITESPDWLQWRLRSIGLEPINNVVDITNYVLHGIGQPLHAFDASVVGKKVIVKTLPKGSKFTTLDEKERKLDEKDLMICNESEGMCIAGVFGGIKSGVKDSTTDIFLESAYFSPDYVRATAMRHGLSTDASFRFERGIDPEITLIALKYATNLIIEIAGGRITSNFIDIYPKPIEKAVIPTKKRTFDRLIGKELDLDEIKGILTQLEINIKEEKGEEFKAVIPAYRSEVTREADLVEEVLRMHGINNIDIDESFSTDYLAEFKEIEPYKLQEEISLYLSGKGYHEIVTNSLTNSKYEENLKLSPNKQIGVLNPSSEELNALKTSPFYTALESIRYNINRRQSNLRFFEFSSSYFETENKDRSEKHWLSVYLTGNSWDESWLADPIKSSIHLISGQVFDILEKCGLKDYETENLSESRDFDFGVSILVNQKEIAQIGKVSENILEYFEIEKEVFSAQIDWDFVIQNASRDILYRAISKYPEVKRDLSLVLDKSISYKEVEKIAFQSEKKLLNRINLFSVFEGKQIGEGKKAYAAAFYLQDKEKTLTDKQIDKCMDRLMSQFEEKLNAIIRK